MMLSLLFTPTPLLHPSLPFSLFARALQWFHPLPYIFVARSLPLPRSVVCLLLVAVLVLTCLGTPPFVDCANTARDAVAQIWQRRAPPPPLRVCAQVAVALLLAFSATHTKCTLPPFTTRHAHPKKWHHHPRPIICSYIFHRFAHAPVFLCENYFPRSSLPRS
jgi:hypothetical protein